MTKLMEQVSINKWTQDFIKEVEEYIQTEIYKKFKLAQINLDWNPRRRTSRGGHYSAGPGISIAMDRMSLSRPLTQHETNEDRVKNTILHEIAHALQYYSYKVNNFRCKPHGITFKNFYRRLRNKFLNPFLPDQKKFKILYNKEINALKKKSAVNWDLNYAGIKRA